MRFVAQPAKRREPGHDLIHVVSDDRVVVFPFPRIGFAVLKVVRGHAENAEMVAEIVGERTHRRFEVLQLQPEIVFLCGHGGAKAVAKPNIAVQPVGVKAFQCRRALSMLPISRRRSFLVKADLLMSPETYEPICSWVSSSISIDVRMMIGIPRVAGICFN